MSAPARSCRHQDVHEGLREGGCALRLGHVDESTWLVLVCEGYATALSLRMATDRQVPVYVALDAYNLGVRRRDPARAASERPTADLRGRRLEVSRPSTAPNPGRRAAKQAAKVTERCDIVWPVFNAATRGRQGHRLQ
jgi:putative DNA primase/helicase